MGTAFYQVVFCSLLIGLADLSPATAGAEANAGVVSVEFGYVADLLHNASGGIKNGSAYLQNVDAMFTLDLRRIPGPGDGSLFAYVLWNDASTFSDRYAGDSQGVSNIEAEQALRLYEFWYEHRFADVLGLRFGLYDLNSEFDAVDSASLFLNSSHGIIPTYSQTGERGPSIFPVTSLTARLHWQIDKHNVIRYALLDAVPGDPDDPSATAIQFNSGEGVLHALEYVRDFSNGLRLGLGAFSYTAKFESLIETDASGNPVRSGGNTGWYGFADASVYEDAARGRSAAAFVRYGAANSALNPFEHYLGAGTVLSGFIPRRPDDQFGIAVAMVRCGGDFRAATGAEGHETAIELTYRARITDGLEIQPDIQYIVNPGTDPALDNALVFGIRIALGRGFELD